MLHGAKSLYGKREDSWASPDGEWTRGRDSNSHDRSCSTMHNLSATTRSGMQLLDSVLYMVCAYISREILANAE